VVARNSLTYDEQETVGNLLGGVVYTSVWNSILFSLPCKYCIESFYASCEIIVMQDILNMGEKLTYLPMFDGL
jgi:hypothetical protein